MENLTTIVPLKIKVVSGKKVVASCPFCKKTVSVSAKMVNRFASKELEVTCSCKKVFFIQFKVQQASLQNTQVTITDLSSQQVYKNIEINALDKEHLSFFCKGHHLFRKGQKVRVRIVRKGSGLSEAPKEAVVHLVRSKYVACYFMNP